MHVCKETCINYKAPLLNALISKYLSGQKRCQFCDIFIVWEGLWCPCCGTKLRTKPRSSKQKQRISAKSQLSNTTLIH